MTLDELPVDVVWPAVARCLTGVSFFDLACASKWTWQLFSQDAYWHDRLTVEETTAHTSSRKEGNNSNEDDEGKPTTTALQRYTRTYSFLFHGLSSKDTSASPSRGSCVEVPHFYHKAFRQGLPFTFDVWFCLLGTDKSNNKHEVRTGGILFSAQSVSYEGDERPPLLRQFAVVSADRKLFSSILDEKPPEIASNLDFNYWYHLALSYNDNKTQRVYLNGQLVSTLYGDLYREWWFVIAAYVGTGQVRAGDQHSPESKYSGWYPFNGLIDQFRWWKQELSSEEIRVLAGQGGGPESVQEEPPHYSLKRDLLDLTSKEVRRMGCSRPKEMAVELLGRKSERGSVKEAEKEPVDYPNVNLGGHNAKNRDTKASILLADHLDDEIASRSVAAVGG